MKKSTLLLLSLLASSGCTAQRFLTIGTPSPVEAAWPGQSDETTWRLGEVHVDVQAQNANGPTPAGIDVAPLKQQLNDRLRATLLAQTALGARAGPARYALEVSLEAIERYGFGRQMGLSLALEIGLFALGMAGGTLLGLATSRASPPDGFNGYLVGAGVSLPVGLLAATLPELAGTAGEYKARLVLRRLSDRVPVAERRVEQAWRVDYNLYGVPAKLAKGAGAGLVEFEKVLLAGLKDMLVELQPEPLPAP